MKNLNNYMVEKLQKLNSKNSYHNYFPKNKEELINLVNKLIQERGIEANLNDIDTSEIDNMTEIFKDSDFNGDISKWDVSNVKEMYGMFDHSKFTGKNGDIGKWDVSKVNCADWMFYHSLFEGNIDNWKLPPWCEKYHMFLKCPLANKLPKWYKCRI